MEIVVNDTNILIDLFEADLLKFCKDMSLEFITLNTVIEEVKLEHQFLAIDSLVKDGILKVDELTPNQMKVLQSKANEYALVDKLSPTDISVLIYAKDNDFRLLTGDRRLRMKAQKEGVLVSCVLYLTDKMVDEGVVDPLLMADSLERMMAANNFLPIKIINERIANLRGEKNKGT